MKNARKRSRFVMFAAVAALAACGDNLIADPSFDLWCDGKLCKPWKSTGKITRVGTWHENDYGVSLGNGATLSQLSDHDRVDCIAFEVIADVSASADMWIEMDFEDDGSSEYKQLVPESHYAKLRYLVATPTWYDNLRFILRKKGKGRAVLAQIKAQPSDECEGDPIPLLDRPLGAECSKAGECMSGVCAHAPAVFQKGLAVGADGKGEVRTCSECAEDIDCGKDALCGAGLGDAGVYRACVPRASLSAGKWCVTDAECGSGICSVPGVLAAGACAECASDDECMDDELCGVGTIGGFATRTCIGAPMRALGDICVEDAECKSGACNEGACSECNDDNPCKGAKQCGIAEAEWLTIEASLCDPGSGERKPGDACTGDEDCRSGECREPDGFCHTCVGPSCKAMTSDCGFLRRLAGTCR